MSRKVAALILAGGKGSRLFALTKKVAKPAVSYGGKYRIIDFPMSNIANTGIKTVGVLTQYESDALNAYIGSGENWGLNGAGCRTSVLSPKETEGGSEWYKGTADAIYCNIDWLDDVNPEYVIILSGDHIYSCTYDNMIAKHVEAGADCTISLYRVPIQEASRFGVMKLDDKDNVVGFWEKPKNPQSDLVSMGIYCFTYKTLRSFLVADAKDKTSNHDFGKNIIPSMLKKGKKIVGYRYEGYWKDVGTIASLHAANMDLLLSNKETGLDLFKNRKLNKIYSEDNYAPPMVIGKKALISDCLINQGAKINGSVDHCVISSKVVVEEGAKVVNSVLMRGCHIGKNAEVYDALVGSFSTVSDNEIINKERKEITLIANAAKEDMR